MKTFRAFGPTIGKGKLSRKFIDIINIRLINLLYLKRMIIALNLQVKLRMKSKLPKTIVNKSLSKELIKNIEDYLKDSKMIKLKKLR